MSSCFISRVHTWGSKLSDYSGERSNEFYVFKKQSADFQMLNIATIEATGGRYSSSSEVYTYLKHYAWELGANVIIGVKKETVEVDTGRYDDDGEPKVYCVDRYEAIAGRIEVTDEFKSKYGEGIGLGFIDSRKSYEERYAKMEKTGNILIGITACAVIVGGLITQAQSD